MSGQSIYPPPVPHMLGFKIVEGVTGYAVSYNFIKAYCWSCRVPKGPAGWGIADEWRELKGHIAGKGYHAVVFQSHGVLKHHYIHRLILEAFVGPCPEGKECLHGVAGKNCNLPSNLSWGTRHENMQDQHRDGTILLGTKNPSCSLSEEVVLQIFRESKTGENQKSIAKRHGVCQMTVSHIKRGVTWKHLTQKDKV